MNHLDTVDRALLDQVQVAFPLAPAPFAVLGQALDLDQNDVLVRLRRLKRTGVIRQIGAIFDTRRLGYQSTLVAFHVGEFVLDEVAALVSAHPGVSHNYARPHNYNLWFTLAVPPHHDLEDEILALARQTGVDDWLNLPALRVFKIRTHFQLDKEKHQGTAAGNGSGPQGAGIEPADIPFVQALQMDLPLVERPFVQMAQRFDLSEASLLTKALDFQSAGIMRRFSAVLRHRSVGYTANGMACWVVPDHRIEEVGRFAARYSQISHCYQRPAYPPRWPYTLFTMIHGRTKAEVDSVVTDIAQKTGLDRYEVLYSTLEFKKERIQYFIA